VSEKRDSFVVSGILSDDHNVSSTYDSESNAMFLLFSVHLIPVYEKIFPIALYGVHYISYLSNISLARIQCVDIHNSYILLFILAFILQKIWVVV